MPLLLIPLLVIPSDSEWEQDECEHTDLMDG